MSCLPRRAPRGQSPSLPRPLLARARAALAPRSAPPAAPARARAIARALQSDVRVRDLAPLACKWADALERAREVAGRADRLAERAEAAQRAASAELDGVLASFAAGDPVRVERLWLAEESFAEATAVAAVSATAVASARAVASSALAAAAVHHEALRCALSGRRGWLDAPHPATP